MDLTSAKTIKELLLNHQASPSKFLGQNFLVHKPTLDTIIKTAGLTSKDTVIEIGPGLGTLTRELAKTAGKVIAIEKDRAMLEILQETLAEYNNTEVIQGDALQYQIPTGNYKVVANIPYYLTSPIIRKFLEDKNPPTQILLMMQKEVAQRICAKPPGMSILAVSVQFYADAKIIAKVPKSSFWPAPKIDSAVINIIPHRFSSLRGPAGPKQSPVPADEFFTVVKAGFIQPRKQLGNNFTKALKQDREVINAWLSQNNISPLQRAETLTINDWIQLTESYTQLQRST